MPTKLAIHAGPPIIDAIAGWEHNRSGRLNGVVARYGELIADERARLRFTADEWALILEAMSDAVTEGRAGADWRNGWATLINRTAGPNSRELGLRIQQMPLLAQCAIWEVAAVYWAGNATLAVVDYLRGENIVPMPARQPEAATP